MPTTKLSTKGQVILPKSVRDAHGWKTGVEFEIEETVDGVLLRPIASAPRTSLKQVIGCLKYTGERRSLEEMEQAIGMEARARHHRGRY